MLRSHAQIMQIYQEIIMLKDILNGLQHLKASGYKFSCLKNENELLSDSHFSFIGGHIGFMQMSLYNNCNEKYFK